MKNNIKIFTSESVTEGHPDKVCDRISDAILTECLKQDKKSRVACETYVSEDYVLVGGEITTTAIIDYTDIVRNTIKDIGYINPNEGFDYKNVNIDIRMKQQSSDIALGANDENNGAGDQGMMFGYATNETENYMPLPIELAHRLTRRLAEVRKLGILDFIKPDGKSQVSVVYENDVPKYIDTIVISTQHTADVDYETLDREIMDKVIMPITSEWLNEETKIFINPTGRFVIGGPKGDVGLTGRKIIVDSYGGYSRHGGGAWSGKDPTKVDKSASYMARYLARNVVASGVASKCEIQLSYAIGVSQPVSIFIDTFGTSKVDDSVIEDIIKDNFDLSPKGIIDKLDLLNVDYTKISAYGHIGREDVELNWEKLDSVELFQKF